MEPLKILCVIGTRPEAIKMAPVIYELKKSPAFNTVVVATAQHRDLLDGINEFFGIDPDIDLNIMSENQTLPVLTSRLLVRMSEVLERESPAAVLIQGDTTTVMVTGMACFYANIPFGHVEAGLRTQDLRNPFPEEFNRVVVGRLARWHFAPTESSRLNLLADGIREDTISVTGNTVIDALEIAKARISAHSRPIVRERDMVLITCHRRENFGRPFLRICRAISLLAKANTDIDFLYAVHPNPNVHRIAHEQLGSLENVLLCDPLSYEEFVSAMIDSSFVLTDSGGVQEEAPALGKPVLVLRDETERPEAVDLGVVKLVGTDVDAIVSSAQNLIDCNESYKKMAKGISPYGDGCASPRIVSVLTNYFSEASNDKV